MIDEGGLRGGLEAEMGNGYMAGLGGHVLARVGGLSLFQISNFKLQISNLKFQIVDFKSQISNFKSPAFKLQMRRGLVDLRTHYGRGQRVWKFGRGALRQTDWGQTWRARGL